MVQEKLQESVAYIRSISTLKPKVGIILGSGLGAFIEDIRVDTRVPFDEIPHFESENGEKVNGTLTLGRVADVPVAVLQGRIHYYEGHSMAQVVFPTRTLAMLGIETLVLTNAAGGLDSHMQAGDFLVIKDHINLMGDNPLKGPNVKNLGPRFPDMSQPYDIQLAERMSQIMKNKNVRHHMGIYAGVSGPTFETPAEVKFLKIIGANAVGMSTVPETIAANHLGLRVAALSCITNLATGIQRHRLSVEEVTENTKSVEAPFRDFMREFIGYLGTT
jgi:purine-nucleoside phosphorylase